MLCVRNISSDWSLTNGTKTGLSGNVYEYAIDYIPLSGVKTIYDIHRYLMKKHNIFLFLILILDSYFNYVSTINLRLIDVLQVVIVKIILTIKFVYQIVLKILV